MHKNAQFYLLFEGRSNTISFGGFPRCSSWLDRTAVISIKNITLFNHVHVQKWSMNCGEPQKRTLFPVTGSWISLCCLFCFSSLSVSSSFWFQGAFFKTLTINSFQEPQRNISKSGPVGAPHRPFTSWNVSFDHEVGRVHPEGKDGSVSSISFRIWPKESGNSLEEWGSGTMNLPASCCFRLDFCLSQWVKHLDWDEPPLGIAKVGENSLPQIQRREPTKKTRVSYL